MAANKVVEIDSIPHKLVKLAGILLSGRTGSHSSVIYFHSSRYLISQKSSFEKLDRFLNMLQLEGIALFQSIMFENKLITYREKLK